MSGATVSINKKWQDGTLIQVGGVGFSDFLTNLAGFVGDDKASEIVGKIAASVTGGASPAPEPTEQQALQNVQNGFPQAQAASPPAQQQAPNCKHGPRAWKSGTSKAGKPYKMWGCTSTDRNDECPPEWVR